MAEFLQRSLTLRGADNEGAASGGARGACPTSFFERYIVMWDLTYDGIPIVTRSSRLLPVRKRGVPAMLKVALEAEERFGNLLMLWWGGQGTAPIMAHEGEALLMERAQGKRSLIDLARKGNDDEASHIICKVVAQLHKPAGLLPPKNIVPLKQWFRQLKPTATLHGGILSLAAKTADELLATPRENVTLHGDVHHGNILDFGQKGWLAIDPKGIRGERGFDYANLFCNPDLPTATPKGRLSRQADIVAQAAGLERRRLLQWILSYAGLSAAWSINDGETPETALSVAELAAAELVMTSPS
jgi:streptomycin 6-kinase